MCNTATVDCYHNHTLPFGWSQKQDSLNFFPAGEVGRPETYSGAQWSSLTASMDTQCHKLIRLPQSLRLCATLVCATTEKQTQDLLENSYDRRYASCQHNSTIKVSIMLIESDILLGQQRQSVDSNMAPRASHYSDHISRNLSIKSTPTCHKALQGYLRSELNWG